jgi:hypothetical protein
MYSQYKQNQTVWLAPLWSVDAGSICVAGSKLFTVFGRGQKCLRVTDVKECSVTCEVLMVQATFNIVRHVTPYSLGSIRVRLSKHFASYREHWWRFFQEKSITFYQSAGCRMTLNSLTYLLNHWLRWNSDK